MELKKANKTVNNNEALKKQLRDEIKAIDSQLIQLREKKMELKKQLLEEDIKPFKIGGFALAEISCGRGKKWQKCLLECENGMLYVRPIKDDGHYSMRHFSITPWGTTDYADYLKEVK